MTTHVLVVRSDNDGDVLLAGPAVRAVAAASTRVAFLCGPRGRAAAALLPGVDAVVEHELPWIDPEPDRVSKEAISALVADIAGRGVDQAFILTSWHQSPLPLALLLKLAGVPFVAAISEDYPGSLLDVRHRVPDDIHEVERSLSLVATGGYTLPAGDDGSLAVKRRPGGVLPALDRYVVVHPGASVPARAWSPDLNAQLVQALADSGRRVVVTGAPSERDLTSYVSGTPRKEVVDLGGRTDLAGLAEVLAGANAVVVGNTGPAHLAAAVGTPVVSLFAPTVPAARWAPWRVPHVVLGVQDIECAGCRAKVCPFEGHPCIGSIPVDVVVNAVEALTCAVGSAGAPLSAVAP